MLKFICSFVMVSMLSCVAIAVELQGVANVSMTSDTAANAKNMAMDEARRQIISDVLRPYVNVDVFTDVLQGTKNADLVPLISGVNIDGEQVSDTMYSAKFTMVLDSNAVRNWLGVNNVQNWIPDNNEQDMFVVHATLTDRLADWGNLNKIARDEKLSLITKSIANNIVVFELPRSGRGAFTIALREQGWRYSDKDGVLNIWK